MPDAEAIRPLVLADDPIPIADAIVAVGHPLNYLPNAAAIHEAVSRIADAVRPGGIVAFDVCDLEWGQARRDVPANTWIEDEWVLITRFSVPSPDRFVREMTTFIRGDDRLWRRDDERHDNVLIDTKQLPGLLAEHDVDADVTNSFGAEPLPTGLRAVIGRRRHMSIQP